MAKSAVPITFKVNQMETFKAKQFAALDLESRYAVDTETAAHHLNRRPQTLRCWASLETGPLRPQRINGRLAWPTSEIRALLGVNLNTGLK